ncbi:cadmium-translocating P-type ATPase [Firmicutes bacterium CAG:341]|uniref:heavy metal translocating P-type ATPase n=1 Tax=Eubacterium sp. TaxID=142586 RepID=UPI000340F6D4|nr:cadmium-translocating P-type ATPase [Firmicutes bacterium CAG:341]
MADNHEHTHDECCCEHNHEHACSYEHNHEDINKGQFLFKLIGGGFFLIAGYILNEVAEKGKIDLPDFSFLVCFMLSYLIVGFDIIKEAVEGVMHKDIFNENLLMTIASLGAFAVGEYSEGCMVVFLFTIGEFLQGLALDKSRKSIKNMLEAKVEVVNIIDGEKEKAISPEEVKIGDLMIIRPGEKLDIDGVITNGTSQFDMKSLTGETIPVTKGVGDSVLAGSVSLDGTVTVKAEKEYKDSTVSRILDMLEKSQDKKSHAQKFITRFARIYTPIVCLIAVLIMVVPPLFFNGQWHEWLYRGLSALVVSCPCALVISIPLSFFAGIGACSREGILVKGGNYLEILAKADTGVFDKTGTLTNGKFEFVTCEHNHCHCKDNQHRELLKIIAACERYSNHPIAKSINVAFGHYADECEVKDSKTYAGLGVSAIVDGVKYYVGNEKLMKEHCNDFKETNVIGTAIYCCSESEFMGDIVFADIIKQDSKDALKALKKLGIAKTVMMTGDKEEIAKDIASKAGIDTVYSRLMPDEKANIVSELQKNGSTVVYTGDGINDAPVLSQADVGVAMGGAGSDIAVEASDMVIMGDSLSKLAIGKKVAKKTIRIVHENIIFAIAVKLLIIIGCAIGIFDENAMWLAVFGDVGVCLIAIANSLRALRVGKIKNK